MRQAGEDEIEALIVRRALAGDGEGALLDVLCRACGERGLPVGRALLIVDTLHPIHEGRVFRWRNDGVEEEGEVGYGRTDRGEAAEAWRASVFFRLLESGESCLRRRLRRGEPAEYAHMGELAESGHTDYAAFVQRFGAAGVVGDLDCIYCYFATRDPAGFSDEGVGVLARLLPALALAIKSASLARIAATLVEVYLGRDARERVLRGGMARGVAERIEAVLWFSDLRGFTAITDTADPGEIIPLLNDYSGAVIDAVHDAGGDVLKLIGDGILAIFNFDDAGEATAAALAAERALRAGTAVIETRRRAEGKPVTSVYIGLHIGAVLYGNIGSQDRLDFTVVGPSVNEVARIASMCRSVDRLVVASAEFRAALPAGARDGLVSVGRYALRGVGRARELFTLDPGLS